MLAKAHRRSPGSVASRIARLNAAVLLCAASLVLALATCAEPSAADALTLPLDAVTHSTGAAAADVSSSVRTTVAPVVDVLPATPPAGAPTPTPTPPSASAGEQTGPPTGPQPLTAAPVQAIATSPGVGAGADEASSHLAASPGLGARAQSGQTPGPSTPLAGEPGPVMSTVLRMAVRHDPPIHIVGDVVGRATRAVAGTQAAATVERVLAPASGASQIVGALARGASSLVVSVAKAGQVIGGLANSVLGPAVPSLRSLGLVRATASPGRAVSPTGAALAPSTALSEARRDPQADSSPARLALDRRLVADTWSVAEATPPPMSRPSPAGAPAAPPAKPSQPAARAASLAADTLPLTGGQSAVLSVAHGAPGASLPVSPAHAPPSPGGVSPATAVGAGGGIAVALALAALLLLAAPHAMRRLRLAAESWLRAPLLLIADRPG